MDRLFFDKEEDDIPEDVEKEDEGDDACPVDGEDGCDDYGDGSHCEEVVVPFGDLFEGEHRDLADKGQ